MELPEKFRDMMHSLGYDDVLDALAFSSPGVSVRLNPLKGGEGCSVASGSPVPWWPAGRILQQRPDFTLDPAMHQGRYYVQESSSMFTAHAVKALLPDTPVLAVDMCAAPGGKSTAALDALPTGSFLVANEFVPQRAEILQENLMKWGRTAVAVTRGDTDALADALRGRAELVIADMPCSGEGMMRKSAEAAAQWSPALVHECAALQRQIAENAWRILAPGGIMLYSTCTFNITENEENVAWMIEKFGAEPVAIPVEEGWGISGAAGRYTFPVYRFMPGRTPGEGLFMAALRKPGYTAAREITPGLTLQKDTEAQRLIPTEWAKTVSRLQKQKNLKVLSAGLKTARSKGRGYIPAHALAMSAEVADEQTPRYAVGREEALSYLRNEAVNTPGMPKGPVLLTYDNYPLGYVNNLGNRANNLYPANYRIRNK